MTRLNSVISGLALSAAAAVPTSALATHYVAGMGSALERDPVFELDTGFGAHALVGMPVSSSVNGELSAFFASSDFEAGGAENDNWGFGLDAMMPLASGGTRPFVLGGLGVMRDSFGAAAAETETSPYIDLGVGVLHALGDRLGLRGELRAYATQYDELPGSEVALDFRLNLGLQFGGFGPARSAERSPAPVPVAAGTPDADRDGVADADDECPGTARGLTVNRKGCVEVSSFKLTGTNFATGSATLSAGAKTLLDSVAATLSKESKVRVEIAGYTDSLGAPAKNAELSKRRAEAAKAYLVQKGIAADRLEARGYGAESPVDSNDTAAGRANNRRVEFRIIR